MSKYNAQPVGTLLLRGESLHQALANGAGARLGIDPETILALAAAELALEEAARSQFEAIALARGATATKVRRKRMLGDLMATIEATVAANPQATDADLRGLGFAARPGPTPRPKVPERVTGLVAVPETSGGVRLSWPRAGASRDAVSFVVESSLDRGATWRWLGVTGRVGFRASGFAPGIPALFRVTAPAAAGAAGPSAPVEIYGIGLRRAA